MNKQITGNQKVKEIKKELSRRFRREPTPAEEVFWGMIRNRRLEGCKFRRQQIIGGFIIDFYCPELALAVEVDGSVHANQKEYDEQRSLYLNDQEIKVIRFSNDDVLEIPDKVRMQLRELLRSRKLTSPPNPLSINGEGEYDE